MAYQDPGKEIEKRTKALVKAINGALEAHYKKAKTKKEQQISVQVSRGPGGRVRTPEEQASQLLAGRSWTCNSSHMSDAGRHVLVKLGMNVTWNLGALQKNHKAAWGVLVQAWNAGMKAQDLRNFRGQKKFAYPSSDPLHVELPDSRLKDTDERVTRCLEIYAKATRLEGKAKNTAFESIKGSAYQKDWLKAYDQKLAAKKGKQP